MVCTNIKETITFQMYNLMYLKTVTYFDFIISLRLYSNLKIFCGCISRCESENCPSMTPATQIPPYVICGLLFFEFCG